LAVVIIFTVSSTDVAKTMADSCLCDCHSIHYSLYHHTRNTTNFITTGIPTSQYSALTILLILYILHHIQVINKIISFVSLLSSKGYFIESHFKKTPKAPWKDIDIVYGSIYFTFCLLGWLGHPFLYCVLVCYYDKYFKLMTENVIDVLLQLFDLIHREEILQNVIKSVTKNIQSLLLTAVLAFILIYFFSIIGFLFFSNDFLLESNPYYLLEEGSCMAEGACIGEENWPIKREPSCETLMMCIVTTLKEGIRNGGGIGDVLRKPSNSVSNKCCIIIHL